MKQGHAGCVAHAQMSGASGFGNSAEDAPDKLISFSRNAELLLDLVGEMAAVFLDAKEAA